MLDPIVEEIHKIREAHAARFNFDIDAIFDDFERREKESGRPVVHLQAKRISSPADAPDRRNQPGGRAA